VGGITPPRPLAETDDRAPFDCGRVSMNHWFRRHGWANHAAGVSRVNVICDTTTSRIAGYVSLSAAQIERASLPKSHRRNMPDPLPATLLGQLAVHREFQARGYARRLLLFALRTALRASQDIASWGVVTHPLDAAMRKFYARHGFQDLSFDLHRAMVVRMADLKKSGFGGE
jgi:GNAT superfamily N-acetyltransferase